MTSSREDTNSSHRSTFGKGASSILERRELRSDDRLRSRCHLTYQGDIEPSSEPDDGFPAVDDLTGRLLGQYRMGPVIGQGSMARVYQAEHQSSAGPAPSRCSTRAWSPASPRFASSSGPRRESSPTCPSHVVTVHNLGTDRDYHYIEMEYVAGGISLKETLVKDGPLEPVRASKLVHQVVQALGAAHRSGLVHRDVKPANVLLTTEGRAKLADFGLVRRHSDPGLAGAKVAGTPTFMAPELFAGSPASPRSDIYAVGVMFYYLLSARLPFSADRISRLIRLHRSRAGP